MEKKSIKDFCEILNSCKRDWSYRFRLENNDSAPIYYVDIMVDGSDVYFDLYTYENGMIIEIDSYMELIYPNEFNDFIKSIEGIEDDVNITDVYIL